MATTAINLAEATPTRAPIVHVAPAEPRRIHYLDNLRAVAMLLGIFLHAAFAYARPAQSIWLATDPGSSAIVDGSIWFIHLFRMPLFFLLSGYFAKLVVQRKGVTQFLLNRTLRIAIPFAMFYPFLLAAMTAVIVFAISYVDAPRGLMGLIAAASKSATQANSLGSQAPGTMHLWFLYYLLIFAALAAMFSRFKRLQFDWLFARPVLMVFMPLMLVPGVLGAGIPLPAPESFVPTWWPFAFYGLFYWAGWQLWGRESCLDKLRPIAPHLAVLIGLLFVAYYLCMPTLDLAQLVRGVGVANDWRLKMAALLTGYLSVMLTIASLLLGQRILQNRSAVLGLIADASYWMYLVHLPLVIFLQTLLIPFTWPVWIKLAITIIGTTLPCLATYLVFVRYTPVGWLLHGKRSFP